MSRLKVTVQCPHCGQYREVTKWYAEEHRKRKMPLLCKSCSRMMASAYSKLNMGRKIIKPKKYIAPCGKELVETREGRCLEYETCEQTSECLAVIQKTDWGGFNVKKV